MPIKDFLDKSVITKRKASQTGAAVEAWLDINTALKCCISPTSYSEGATLSQSTYLPSNISHKMYCQKGEDLKIGDKIVDGEDEFLVKRFLPWSHSGISFLKVYLSEIK